MEQQQLYAVVYQHQYSPQGYRVYRSVYRLVQSIPPYILSDKNDKYLEEYPSMYTMIEDSLSRQAAESLCIELNEREWEYMSTLMAGMHHKPAE